jgi:hypothetical protein
MIFVQQAGPVKFLVPNGNERVDAHQIHVGFLQQMQAEINSVKLKPYEAGNAAENMVNVILQS